MFQQIKQLIQSTVLAVDEIQELRSLLKVNETEPVDQVKWVPIDMVKSNDYNPNVVPAIEMKLLYLSILYDGYTQPIVTVWSEAEQKYIIVDGFHRYQVMVNNLDICCRCQGLLPIVVIDKGDNDRMASTIRHNRARGKHSVAGMSALVFEMFQNGWGDDRICQQLGMEKEELMRLKHITGFAKLFEGMEYKMAWETQKQINYRIEAEKQGIRTIKTRGH